MHLPAEKDIEVPLSTAAAGHGASGRNTRCASTMPDRMMRITYAGRREDMRGAAQSTRSKKRIDLDHGESTARQAITQNSEKARAARLTWSLAVELDQAFYCLS
jgi:hypothetical protein